MKIELVKLPPRAMQIAKLVIGGHSNAEIGKILAIKERTVKDYMGRVMLACQVESRYELIAKYGRGA